VAAGVGADGRHERDGGLASLGLADEEPAGMVEESAGSAGSAGEPGVLGDEPGGPEPVGLGDEQVGSADDDSCRLADDTRLATAHDGPLAVAHGEPRAIVDDALLAVADDAPSGDVRGDRAVRGSAGDERAGAEADTLARAEQSRGAMTREKRSDEVVGGVRLAVPDQQLGDGRRLIRAAMAEVRSRLEASNAQLADAGPDETVADRPTDAEKDAVIRDLGRTAESAAPRAADSRKPADERTAVQPAARPTSVQPAGIPAAVQPAGVPAAVQPAGVPAAVQAAGIPAALPPAVGPAAIYPTGLGTTETTPVGGVTAAVPRMARDDTPSRRITREGDRVDGWVRPDYRSQPDITGDYWTPVPEGEYGDGGYGWPVPVERLPAVPPYPPASGFDLPPVNEPTAVVPQWPPAQPSGRIETPRAWRGADEEPRREADKDDRRWAERDRQSPPRWPIEPADPEPSDGGSQRRHAVLIDWPEPGDQPAWSRLGQRRRVSPVTEHIPAVADSTQMLPSVDGLVAERGDGERPRRRPRPRPRPQQPDKSTVYVSKHAADPI
jgi:hypothetical protein